MPATGTPSPTRAAGLCPRCTAPFDADQEYCLECGLRLPWENPFFARLTAKASGRSSGWVPRDWVWPALLALIVAAAGAGAAIVTSRDAGANAGQISTAIGGNPPAPDAASSLSAAEARGAASTSATRGSSGRLVSWPLGKNGWTIVLVSLDQRRGLQAAREKAQEALAHGLPNVGIIDSSRFPSLHPGYYVIFTGIYASEEEATGALRRAKAAFRTAYTSEVAA